VPFAAQPAPPANRDEGSIADAAAGFRLLLANADARSMIALLGAEYAVIGALDVLFVVLAVDVLALGGSGAGYLNGAFGAGGVIGIAATIALVGRRRLVPALVAAMALWGAACAAIGLWPTAAGALVLLAVAGAGRSVFDVAGRTLLQRSASAELLGRAFGAVEGLSMAGMALGALVTPALVGAGGATLALAATGALLPVLALVYLRRLRALDARADVPVVEIALLRLLPMMAVLAPPELERVARLLESRELAPGEVVIRQGDPADAFFLVAAGELDVIRDGVMVAELARADGFGEIGLLGDRPRTATVRARTDGHVVVLRRDAFLDAMSRNPRGAHEAHRLASARMDDGRNETRTHERDAAYP
jgi:CRP-like cAMP-binding protein